MRRRLRWISVRVRGPVDQEESEIRNAKVPGARQLVSQDALCVSFEKRGSPTLGFEHPIDGGRVPSSCGT